MADLSSSRGGPVRGSRQGRDTAALGQAPQTSVAQRVIQQRPATVGLETGLESMRGSFANFYGNVARATDTFAQVDHAGDMARIAEENEAQKIEAARLALAGEALTPEQTGDRDYVDTFAQTLGRQDGAALAATFKSEVAPLVPLTDDIEEHAQRFMLENMKGDEDALGLGLGAYDVNFMASFSEGTRTTRTNHRATGTQAQLAEGRTAHDSTIIANYLSLSAEDIPRLIDERRALMPLDPNAAPAAVMNALTVAAGSRPAEATRVMQMINDPMSGRDGRSFADLYPESATQIEETLVNQYVSGKSLEASQMYQEMTTAAALATDPAQVAFMLDTVLGDMHEVYGLGSGQWERTRGALMDRYDFLAEGVINRNRYMGMLYEGDRHDPAFLRDNQQAVMDAMGVNPLENPREAGDLVSRTRVIAPNLKTEMSGYLTDMTSPSDVASAVNFYQSIEARDGWEATKAMIEPAARPAYRYIRDRMLFRGQDPVELVESYNRNRDTIQAAQEVTWRELTGKTTVRDGEVALRDEITAEFTDKFGEDVTLTPEATMSLMNIVRQEAVTRQRYGASHWKESVADTIDAVEGLQVYPGEGQLGSFGTSTLIAGHTMIPTSIDQPGFGEFMNQETGSMENTLDTFRSDARAYVSLFADSPNMADIDSDEVSVSGNSMWAPEGVWTLMTRGEPMMLIPGETLTVGGRELLIPEDPTMAANLLEEFPWQDLPGMQQQESPQGPLAQAFTGDRRVAQQPHERLVLVPYPAVNPIGYVMGYRPGFKWRNPTTEELEAEYEVRQPFTPGDPNRAFQAIEDAGALGAAEQFVPAESLRTAEELRARRSPPTQEVEE